EQDGHAPRPDGRDRCLRPRRLPRKPRTETTRRDDHGRPGQARVHRPHTARRAQPASPRPKPTPRPVGRNHAPRRVASPASYRPKTRTNPIKSALLAYHTTPPPKTPPPHDKRALHQGHRALVHPVETAESPVEVIAHYRFRPPQHTTT